MVGETVTVLTREQTGIDAFNNLVWEWVEQDVKNVLVAPGDVSDNIETTRPEGTDVRYTLYFPKTFDGDLESSKIRVRGEDFHVIGRPDHFDLAVCPTEWWMVVKVGVLHG